MKKLMIGIVLLLVIAIGGLAVALMTVDVDQFRPRIEASLSSALGRPVSIGKMTLSLRELAFTADAIEIGDDPAFAKLPFVKADQLAVRVAPWPLISKRELQITHLILEQPVIRLVQGRKATWNFVSLTPGETPPESNSPALRIDSLRINDGQVTFAFADGSQNMLSDLDITADNMSMDSTFPLKITGTGPGGAQMLIDAQVGPLLTANMMNSPFSAELTLDGFDLASGLSGGGLAGTLAYRGKLNATAGKIDLDGSATLDALRLFPDAAVAPSPVRFAHRTRYDLNSQRGQISNGEFSLGAAVLALAGQLDNRGKQLRVDLSIDGKALAVDEVQGLLPMLGIVMPENSRLQGGQLNLDLDARGALDAMVISGPVKLENSRLNGFSLGGKLAGVMTLAGLNAPANTEIKSASTLLRVDPDGVNLDEILAIITDIGQVTGAGTLDAKQNLDFALRIAPDAALSSSGEGSGIGSIALALQGALGKSNRDGIGLKVTGTADDPKFKLETRAVAGAVLSGLLAGKSGDGAADATIDKDALQEKAADAVLKGLFGKKKKEVSPEESDNGGN